MQYSQPDGIAKEHSAGMATDYLNRGKTIQIPAAYSDTSGVSWRTQSTATNRRLSSTRPRHQYTTEEDLLRYHAVSVIETWWWSTKNRKVFRILKDTIRSAEHSLTNDVIRKVCPSEAELLKDPTMKAKIKFRFGGERFPPVIMFKIFVSGRTTGVRYISGKQMIRPASNAAKDAQRHMGSRVFYNQMLVDACQHQQLKITDEIDVTTMKEYMQYVATVDESPAYLGGKDNTWRKLNLQALPRHSMMYSVIELLERSAAATPSRGGSRGLSLEKLRSFTRPPSQMEQIQRIKTVSSLGVGGSVERGAGGGGGSSRGPHGSRLARQRAKKMKEIYTTKSPNTTQGIEDEGEELTGGDTREGGESDTELDREASDLYEWTQNLSFEDVQ